MAEGLTTPAAKRLKRDAAIVAEPIQPSSITSEIGPGDETLTPNDAVRVLEELLSAQNQSYVLGLKLQLPLHIVEGICKDHLQPRDRLLQVLIEFMRQVDPRPTWRVIVDALKSPAVNLPRLGKIVEAVHFPQNKMVTRASSGEIKIPPGVETVQFPATTQPSKQTLDNPQNTASPKSLASRPTLPELLNFKTSSGSTVNIVEQIATHYSTLGPLLLNDKTGAVTSNIVSQYQCNAVAINQQILTRWMQGMGKKPVAWSTLISILRDIELSELAKTIEDYLMTQIDAQLKEQKMKNTKLQQELEMHKQEMEDKIRQLQDEIKQKETEKNILVEANNKELAQAQKQPSGIEFYRWRSRSVDFQGQKLELQQFVSYTCHVSGPGLQSATANHSTHVIVELPDSGNRPRSLRQNVTAELEPVFKAPPNHPCRTVNATVYALSPSKYEISYTPLSRGQHKLCVRINGVEIDRSPFTVTVYPNPTQLGYRLKLMRNVITPHNIAVNSCGKFVISERADHQIAIFDPNGRRCQTFGTHSTNPDGMKRPRGIAIDDTDNIYVSSENKLQKFTSRGELIKCFGEKGSKGGEFNQPHGIVLFNKELYVCDSINDRIQVFDMDLEYIRSIGSFGKEMGKFSIPRDIKFDRDGNMYIAEWGNARVQVLDSRGHFIRMFGEEDKLGRPSALHIVDEYVYVSDLRNDCIVVYETSGKFVTSFGKCGDGEREFASPRSITSCADGYIYICDQDNNRVQVF